MLYKESQPAKVFHLSSSARRWAAAAAVILLMGSAMWLLLDKPEEANRSFAQNPAATTEPEQSSVKNIIKEALAPTAQEQLAASTTITTPAGTGSVKTTDTRPAHNNNQVSLPTEKNNNPVITETPVIAKIETPILTETEKKSTPDSNNSYTATVPQETSTASIASYASYNNDTDEENENSLFNEERQRRSGLKALVKKAKRMIERKTGIQSNDSEVRFAVFAVNTQ